MSLCFTIKFPALSAFPEIPYCQSCNCSIILLPVSKGFLNTQNMRDDLGYVVQQVRPEYSYRTVETA